MSIISNWVASGSLARGSTGPTVRAVQEALNASGARLDVDGIFGPATESALKLFQAGHRLNITGVSDSSLFQ